MATPNITLTAKLQDITGAAAGTTTDPGIVRIALANFGLTLPCIIGTSNIAQPGPEDFYDLGTGIGAGAGIKLWGNDQITPAGTYYAIALIDGDGNIVQTGIYQFTGTATVDLSSATQVYPVPPPQPPLIPVYTNLPGSPTQEIDGSIVIDGNLTVLGSFAFSYSVLTLAIGGGGAVVVDCHAGSVFYLLLTQNVTITFNNLTPGQTLTFMIQQDGTGDWTVTWPAGVLNFIDPVNPVADGKTLQKFDTWPDDTLMQPGYYP